MFRLGIYLGERAIPREDLQIGMSPNPVEDVVYIGRRRLAKDSGVENLTPLHLDSLSFTAAAVFVRDGTPLIEDGDMKVHSRIDRERLSLIKQALEIAGNYKTELLPDNPDYNDPCKNPLASTDGKYHRITIERRNPLRDKFGNSLVLL